MTTLEELLAIMKFEQEHRFTQMETFTSLIRGKALIGVAEASTRTKENSHYDSYCPYYYCGK